MSRRLVTGALSKVQPQFRAPLPNRIAMEKLYCTTLTSQEKEVHRNDEKSEFMAVFSDLNRDLSHEVMPKDLRDLLSGHMSDCIQYTVPDGKKNRGYSVPASYRLLVSPDQMTEDNIRLANILGWTVEFLQAFFLVADDIMDDSETRRGKLCWYKQSDVGLAAFNDSILLETCVYSILAKYFKDKPYYPVLLELMHETTRLTAMGQALDLSAAAAFNAKRGQLESLDHFTMKRYKAIVKYKTSYYSFYLPVALAMHMAEIKDPNLFSAAKTILLDMGTFFQVQDDYLDCYGDPTVTGKVGTDIQDGKCSWLVTVALQRINAHQRAELAKRYGTHDPDDVNWVKELYNEIGIKKIYKKYEEDFYEDIQQNIQLRGDEISAKMFNRFLDRIYKRDK